MVSATVCAGATTANELPVGGEALGLTVHGPAQTLERYCRYDPQGTLWLGLPGGARFELVTSALDPAIANPGDGAFHPFDEAEVAAALGAVRFPIAGIRADVFILPYPRRLGLDSAAGAELILLSPGVYPISRERQQAEFVHELGHLVQYALMPDADAAGWEVYRKLRGIEDPSVYSASGPHANRPHEIFAEDFRALFGGPLATASGSIENPALPPPSQVPGLEPFMLGLPRASRLASTLTGTPNPSRGELRFGAAGGPPGPLDVFDAAGRLRITLEPLASRGRVEWHWDGRDAAGRWIGPGVVFARARGAARARARVVLLR